MKSLSSHFFLWAVTAGLTLSFCAFAEFKIPSTKPPATIVAEATPNTPAATPPADTTAPTTTAPTTATPPATATTPAADDNQAADDATDKAAADDGGEKKPEGSLLAADVNKSAGISKLLKKLTNKDGKLDKIILLAPLDYTTLNFSELAATTIQKGVLKYGKFDIKNQTYHLNSLTLEEFRRVVTRTQGDIILVTVLKPTNFDLFLYDRRTPYFVYAHSEVLPENIQYKLTPDIVTEYSRLLIRRTLYAYIQDQYYELPREESPQVMHTEIPRWIATTETLQTVNKDITSNNYLGLGYGGALSVGNGGGWSSNLLSGEIGFRLLQDVYLEGALDAFAYNAFSVSAKYAIVDRESPFRYYLGAGLGFAFNNHVLNYDQVYSQPPTTNPFLVLTAAVTFPVLDVHFKLESRLFLGPATTFTLTPGILFLF